MKQVAVVGHYKAFLEFARTFAGQPVLFSAAKDCFTVGGACYRHVIRTQQAHLGEWEAYKIVGAYDQYIPAGLLRIVESAVARYEVRARNEAIFKMALLDGVLRKTGPDQYSAEAL